MSRNPTFFLLSAKTRRITKWTWWLKTNINHNCKFRSNMWHSGMLFGGHFIDFLYNKVWTFLFLKLIPKLKMHCWHPNVGYRKEPNKIPFILYSVKGTLFDTIYWFNWLTPKAYFPLIYQVLYVEKHCCCVRGTKYI